MWAQMPQRPPTAELFFKRLNRERSRKLKPINIDHREYDYAETITRISIGSQKDFDDYIHSLAQTARYERRDHCFLWSEHWIATEGDYGALNKGDYAVLSFEKFQMFIKIRNDEALSFTRGRYKTPPPLPVLLREGNFIDGYIIGCDEPGSFDLIARLDDKYVRFQAINLG